MTSTTPRPVDGPHLDLGAGPPVVLVHGANTDHRIWAPHARRIGPRFRVLASTQRYFGTSPWPDDGEHFSIGTHAEDLANFVRSLQLEPVTLVGWSYGAAVCLMMAARQAELVQRLILYEPGTASFVSEPADARAAAADRLAMTAPARARLDEGDDSGAVRLFMDGVNDRDGSFDDLRRLGGTPVVVARSDATRTFYRTAARWASACIPASTLVVVPNARHLLPVEDDARFSALILELLG